MKASKKFYDYASNGAKQKPIEYGNEGTHLLELVQELASQIVGVAKRNIRVLWFSNIHLIASALVSRGEWQLGVSTGLWRRALQRDPLVKVILLHAIAHLLNNDPSFFARLECCIEATRLELLLIRAVVIGQVLLTCLGAWILDILNHQPFLLILRHQGGLIAISILLLSTFVLAEATVRRYAGFLAALVEVRADVSAALWGDGLEKVASLMASDSRVHQSNARELTNALFTLNLSHFTEQERWRLLASPARLVTPKVTYFLFAFALAIVVPLNEITPNVAYGIIDIGSVLLVAAAYCVCAVAMLTLTAQDLAFRMPWSKLASIAAVMCCLTAASKINLYNIGFFLGWCAVSYGLFPATTTNEANSSEVLSDLQTSIHGIVSEVTSSLGNGWILVSIGISMIALWCLSVCARFVYVRGGRPRWHIPLLAVVVVLATVIDGNDGYRTMSIDVGFLHNGFEGWTFVTQQAPWLRTSLASISAAIVLAVLASVRLVVSGRNKTNRE